MQEANITTSGYVSDEVKEQQQFHHYNNTNFFVTFRGKYLKQTPIKELAHNVIKPFLVSSGTVKSLKVKKIYQSYVIYEVSDLAELRPAADLLTSQREEVLACEWLNKRRIFGVHADIGEMAKFKTKIRKEEDITGKKK